MNCSKAIDRDEERLHYLLLFAFVGKYSALMWHHNSVCGSVVRGVVESRRHYQEHLRYIRTFATIPQGAKIRNLIPRVTSNGIWKGDL